MTWKEFSAEVERQIEKLKIPEDFKIAYIDFAWIDAYQIEVVADNTKKEIVIVEGSWWEVDKNEQ